MIFAFDDLWVLPHGRILEGVNTSIDNETGQKSSVKHTLHCKETYTLYIVQCIPKKMLIECIFFPWTCILTNIGTLCILANIGSPCILANILAPCTLANIGTPFILGNIGTPCILANIGTHCTLANIGTPCILAIIGTLCTLTNIGTPCKLATIGTPYLLENIGTPCILANIGTPCILANIGALLWCLKKTMASAPFLEQHVKGWQHNVVSCWWGWDHATQTNYNNNSNNKCLFNLRRQKIQKNYLYPSFFSVCINLIIK